ncbi:MAG TPA: hypothetical protein PLD26_09500 [Smithella sp.]|nr:hypothetical protein [Smithella sp.]
MPKTDHCQGPLKDPSEDGYLPVDHQDFRIIEREGINYYLVDLRKAAMNALRDIIEGCAAVEQECWKSQEDFSHYIQKCDMLSYAVLDRRIIGFCAGSLFVHDAIFIYSNDETMVLREFHHRNIARNMVFCNMRWILQSRHDEGIKHYAFMSISGNPRIVNGYYNHSFLIKILFDCSFKASDKLIRALDAYRHQYKISLVHEDYPFCLKNMFPGSNTFNPSDQRFQFLKRVKRNMPADFDHMERGDAFAFLVKLPAWFTRTFVFGLMVLAFGRRFFSRRGIGFFAGN